MHTFLQSACKALVNSDPALTALQMKEHLNAGEALPVEMAEVAQLRLEVRRRDWEESARRVLSPAGRQNTVSSIGRVLAGAEESGVGSAALVQALREKMEAGHAWDARAAELLDRQGGAAARCGWLIVCCDQMLCLPIESTPCVPTSYLPAGCLPEAERPTLEQLHLFVAEGFATGAWRCEGLARLGCVLPTSSA